MRFSTRACLLVRETVIVESVDEGDGCVDGEGFFFEAHEDGFTWVLV